MSKVKMNATTVDLISALKLKDIQMLEKIDSPALTLRDDKDNCLFKVMTGPAGATTKDAIMFHSADMDGNAVVTFSIDATTERTALFNAIYDKVGTVKAKLDQVETAAAAAIEAETAAKTAFLAEINPDAANTTAPAAE